MKKARKENEEACKNFEHKRSEEVFEEGRMRRVPDFLPVSMQDQLYGRQSELRSSKVIRTDLCKETDS